MTDLPRMEMRRSEIERAVDDRYAAALKQVGHARQQIDKVNLLLSQLDDERRFAAPLTGVAPVDAGSAMMIEKDREFDRRPLACWDGFGHNVAEPGGCIPMRISSSNELTPGISHAVSLPTSSETATKTQKWIIVEYSHDGLTRSSEPTKGGGNVAIAFLRHCLSPLGAAASR